MSGLDNFLSECFPGLVLSGPAESAPAVPGVASVPEVVQVAPCEADATTEVSEVRVPLGAHSKEGSDCPHCGQYMRVYVRKLNRNMMLFLRSLARKPGEWVSFRECEFTSRDYPYVSFWGLAVTRVDANDGTKRASGFWKITQKGLDFLAARLAVPSHVHVYNNKVVGWSDTVTTASQAYGEDFDYSELMESTVL